MSDLSIAVMVAATCSPRMCLFHSEDVFNTGIVYIYHIVNRCKWHSYSLLCTMHGKKRFPNSMVKQVRWYIAFAGLIKPCEHFPEKCAILQTCHNWGRAWASPSIVRNGTYVKFTKIYWTKMVYPTLLLNRVCTSHLQKYTERMRFASHCCWWYVA